MSKIIYLLIMDKVALRNKFSSEYAKYYQVHLFEKEGFIRKKCSNCNNNF